MIGFMRKSARRISTVAAAVALAGTAVVAGPASPASADDFVKTIQNINSGKCLVAQGTSDGGRAFQYGCSWQFEDQKWWLDWSYDDGQGKAMIKNSNSGKCLTVQGYSDGARAFQYQCGPFADQIWELDSTSEGGFQIRNIHSQKCLVVQGLQDGNGAIQATCDSRFADQRWKL
ncbi:RICIN domain-containing protein [Streptomyces sp. NPDC032472]|uniref:RICIN domain-containing protein n=1 Tax=Streptomyces sp. NPDC032472 TaxID=3155018 RepID=UPI0033E5BEF0